MSNWTREDIAMCNQIASESPHAMRGAALMAVLSIQQSWHTVPKMMTDVINNGEDSKHLWGFKAETYAYLMDDLNMDHLYATTMTESDPVKLLDLWTTVPGLGLAKAGFVVQLTRGMIGCIDSHNARAYDVGAQALRLDKNLTCATIQHKLETYVNLCKTIGGSEFLWKQWCTLMAGKYAANYNGNPEQVSFYHVHIMEKYRDAE